MPKSMVGIQDVNQAVMLFRISAEGRVVDIEPVNATSPALVDAAEEVIRDWRYKPATMNGKPIPYTVHYALHFRSLQDGRSFH